MTVYFRLKFRNETQEDYLFEKAIWEAAMRRLGHIIG